MKSTITRTLVSRMIPFCALILCLLYTPLALGQLQITELLFDSLSSEPRWEWFELRNAGSTNVDLSDAVFDDNTGAAWSAPNLGTGPTNWVLAPGQVGVVYNGAAFDFDDSRFRNAWPGAGSARLLGATDWAVLNNGGDAFGVWPDLAAYQSDLGTVGGVNQVTSFKHAAAWIDYSTNFPAGGAGESSYWNLLGNYQDGANWQVSSAGIDQATLSVPTTIVQQINSELDVANPGIVPPGEPTGDLQITEIMFNPASPESTWEWIEVFNGTGSDIDFATTPHFLDDSTGINITANLSVGSIAAGDVAVMFNDELSTENMRDAWGAFGNVNFIPVADWSSLNNGGDSIGIWSEPLLYENDRLAGTLDNAISGLTYDDASPWPIDDGMSSFSLVDLGQSGESGSDWTLSSSDPISFNSAPVVAGATEHVGGDSGSPGLLTVPEPNSIGIIFCSVAVWALRRNE